MALSLVTTLAAAVLFQPALLTTQRRTAPVVLPNRAKKGDGVAKQ